MFTDKYLEASKWLSLPKSERVETGYGNLRELARHLKVSYPTIQNYRRKWEKEQENGPVDFDIKEFYRGNMQAIAQKLLKVIMEKGQAKHIEMALKILGELVDKQEVKQSFELTVNDRRTLAEDIIGELRKELQGQGVCPVCFQRQKVRHQPHLDTEPKFSEDSQVEPVALLT